MNIVLDIRYFLKMRIAAGDWIIEEGYGGMIGFRVDANEKIATGHLMRCIAIATECRKRGEQCLFLLAEDKETSRLMDRNFPFQVLHSDWQNMESELDSLGEIICRKKLDWLVVDSYQATARYLAKLNQIVPVLYVDDMAREKYEVSALLHYGLCGDLEMYLETYRGEPVHIMAGTEYIPLREEFTSPHQMLEDECKVPSSETVEKERREKGILITTGGTDPYNITGQLLRSCLEQDVFVGYQYHVIVGSMNAYEAELRVIADQHPEVRLHKNVTNISDYMRGCEVAVSAGGTTLFELCACGTPTVCFSFAENQKGGTVDMGRRGIMLYAGDAREGDIVPCILEHLGDFAESESLRSEYTTRMKKLVDGRGVRRIVDYLTSGVELSGC